MKKLDSVVEALRGKRKMFKKIWNKIKSGLHLKMK